MSLPTADDLFRRTGENATRVRAVPDAPDPEEAPPESEQAEDQGQQEKRPSGRVRHDEKMTVYVTSEELLDLEHTRLVLRREYGMAVDRGRLVREAVAMVLADFERNGGESALVQCLTEGSGEG